VEEAALTLAAREDPDAFARLYDRTVAELYRYALSLTRAASAEDVTAEPIAGHSRIDRYERRQAIVAWLCTIAQTSSATALAAPRKQC
jgi:DNA-directed RNA polymerase specialized sigma24 family protein